MYLFCRNPRINKKAVLLDVLPTLVEESSDDELDTNRSEHQDLDVHDAHKPAIRKMVSEFFNSVSKSNNSSC